MSSGVHFADRGSGGSELRSMPIAPSSLAIALRVASYWGVAISQYGHEAASGQPEMCRASHLPGVRRQRHADGGGRRMDRWQQPPD